MFGWILSIIWYLSKTALLTSSGILLVYFVLRKSRLLYSPSIPAKVSFYASLLAESAVILQLSMLGIVLFAPFLVMGRRRTDILYWVMTITRHYLIDKVLGLRIMVVDREGKEIPDGHKCLEQLQPAIYIMNHQTHLDAILLGLLAPKNCSVLMKRSLLFVPFLGFVSWLAGCVFIDRFKKDKALANMQVAGERIKSEKLGVMVFPEGTRSKSESLELLPFKKGAFHLAVQTEAPLVPIIFRWYKKDVINFNKNICRFDNAIIQVRILDPIPTFGKRSADVDALIQESHSLMLNSLKEISSKEHN